jgi:hypothetical protein
MDPDQVRRMILARELSLPYKIVTRGGKTYAVADHANAFLTPAYPDTLIVAMPNRGIALVGLGSIDAIHYEHEAAIGAARG